VINYANNETRAQELLKELHTIPQTSQASQSNDKPRFEALRADVGDKPALQQLVKDTVSLFGRLDVVVSNAGWTRITNFNNLDEGMVDEDWDKCFLYDQPLLSLNGMSIVLMAVPTGTTSKPTSGCCMLLKSNLRRMKVHSSLLPALLE
jgi:NADP-dependent 3-hydroxy acid dehydrogenase YdfG